MQHLNDNKLVVIEIRATGPRVGVDEILQLSALALGNDCKPDKKIMPFNMYIKPIHIRSAKTREFTPLSKSMETKLVKFSLFKKALKEGHDQWKVGELFEYWFDTLKLKYNHRIMPLAHDWPVKRPHLIEFFGQLRFDHMFDWRYRDIIPAAIHMNDKADLMNERCPFPKQNFNYIVSMLDEKRHPTKDALLDCVSIANTYKQMIQAFNLRRFASSTNPSLGESTEQT